MTDLLLGSNRLIDYIIIVGSSQNQDNDNCDDASNNRTTPNLLQRYPKYDHKDAPLPLNVVCFCQPDSCIYVEKKGFLTNQKTSFIFTLTDKDSNLVRYGTCLNFFRSNIKNKIETPSSTTTSSTTIASTNEISTETDDESSASSTSFSLTSLCIISRYPFFSKYRLCLDALKSIIESIKQECLNKENCLNDCELLWKYLLNENPINDHIQTHIDYINGWINNLLNAPVPIPGKTLIQVHMYPDYFGKPLYFAMPDTQKRLSLVDFPVHIPFELLGVKVCLQVLICIMLEQKVILKSRDYNSLTMTVMALTKLLYPLEYMFPIIPLLPNSMPDAEQLLMAPTPYIIGIPDTFLLGKKSFTLPHDIWLVDLDNATMHQGESLDAIPPLPKPDGQVLIDELQSILDNLSASDPPIDLISVNKNKNSIFFGTDVDSADVATRVALIKFLNCDNVLGNFVEHTRTLRLYPRPVVAFQAEAFRKSRKNPSSFIDKLSNTQAVEYFAEWCVCPENEVFRRILTGIDDPHDIGDKPKWYSHELIIKDYYLCSTSEQNYFPLSVDANHSNHENTNQKVNNSTSNDSSPALRDLDENMQKLKHNRSPPQSSANDSYRSSSVLTSVDQRPRKIKRTSSSIQASAINASSSSTSTTTTQANVSKDNFTTSRGIGSAGASSSDLLLASSSAMKSQINPNGHKVLKNIIDQIFEGKSINVMNRGKIKNLLEDENFRNFVLSEIHCKLDKKINSNDVHVDDVELPSMNVYQAIVSVLDLIIIGLEFSQKNYHVGGVASAFILLEILHTHYVSLDNSMAKGSRNSSQESLSRGTKEKEDSGIISNVTSTATVAAAINNAAANVINEDISHEEQLSSTKSKAIDSVTAVAPTSLSLAPPTHESQPCSRVTTPSFESINGSHKSHSFAPTPVNSALKSRLSSGYHYSNGQLLSIVGESPLNDSRDNKRSNSLSLAPPPHQLLLLPSRTYLFEEFVNKKKRSSLWDQHQFWEYIFMDAVTQERDILGLNQDPRQMLDRYAKLSLNKKKSLEMEEDRLLAFMLHNMLAFMIMMDLPFADVKMRLRRLLAKCHIRCHYSQELHKLLDCVQFLRGNDIDLKPLPSRCQAQRLSVHVHCGKDNSGTTLFCEVGEDCLILRSIQGIIVERWWYDQLLNFTYNPRSKIISFSWKKSDGRMEINTYYTKKCKELYDAIEKAVQQGKEKEFPEGDALFLKDDAEFDIFDSQLREKGTLQVVLDTIHISFPSDKQSIHICYLKSCACHKSDEIQLEYLDKRTDRLVIRRLQMEKSSVIARQLLRVISIQHIRNQAPHVTATVVETRSQNE